MIDNIAALHFASQIECFLFDRIEIYGRMVVAKPVVHAGKHILQVCKWNVYIPSQKI